MSFTIQSLSSTLKSLTADEIQTLSKSLGDLQVKPSNRKKRKTPSSDLTVAKRVKLELPKPNCSKMEKKTDLTKRVTFTPPSAPRKKITEDDTLLRLFDRANIKEGARKKLF